MTGDKQNEATAEFNEALAAGFAAGNFDALGPFYTEDASLMPPRGQFLEGRAAACTFWVNVANRFTGVVFTTVQAKSLGDAVVRESGTYVMQTADGPGAQGKYVFVWQLVDGEWQIESGIWNRNSEAGAGAGRRQGQGQGQGQPQGQGAGAAGGGGGRYRQAGGQAGGQGSGQGSGYRQGGGRPSFQGGGQRQGGGGGQRQGAGGRQGGGGRQGAYGGGSLYDGNGGLYSNKQD